LVASDLSIGLYDISSIEVTPVLLATDPLTWPHPSPTWKIGYRGFWGLSQPYYRSNESRLIVGNEHSVKGIAIPCSSGRRGAESQPKLVMLMPVGLFHWDNSLRCHFGYNSAVMINYVPPGPRLKMLYYSWPEGSPMPFLSSSSSLVGHFDDISRSPEYSAFDEFSGRVVLKASNEVLVYDFAKF